MKPFDREAASSYVALFVAVQLIAAGACARSENREQDGLLTTVGPFQMTLPTKAYVDHLEGPDFDRFDILDEDVPTFILSLYLGYAPSFPLIAGDARQEESHIDGLRIRKALPNDPGGHRCLEDVLFEPLERQRGVEQMPQESLHLWFRLDDPRACELATKILASVGRVKPAALEEWRPRTIGSPPARESRRPPRPAAHPVAPGTCRNGFGPQEDPRYSLYVFCDDAVGTTIGIARTELGESPSSSWPLADRFWQDELWCRDVTSYLWLPDHVLLVATSSVYGSGGLYELRVEDRQAKPLLPEASMPADIFIKAYDPHLRKVDLLIESDGTSRYESLILP